MGVPLTTAGCVLAAYAEAVYPFMQSYSEVSNDRLKEIRDRPLLAGCCP